MTLLLPRTIGPKALLDAGVVRLDDLLVEHLAGRARPHLVTYVTSLDVVGSCWSATLLASPTPARCLSWERILPISTEQAADRYKGSSHRSSQQRWPASQDFFPHPGQMSVLGTDSSYKYRASC
jgi:hypothetical protein